MAEGGATVRHLGSVLLALLAAPVVLVLTGRGLRGLAEAAEADRTDHFAIVTSATALGFAGLLFGLLTMAKISPLGPTLAGGGFLAVGVWALNDPDRLLATVPDEPIGIADDQVLAAAAVAPLLAAPLLLTLFLPRRWRGRVRPDGPVPVQPGWPAGPPAAGQPPEPAGPPIALVAPPVAPPPAAYQPPTSVPPSPPPPPWRPISPPPPAPPPARTPAQASAPDDEPTDVIANEDPTVTPSSPAAEQTTANLHQPGIPPRP